MWWDVMCKSACSNNHISLVPDWSLIVSTLSCLCVKNTRRSTMGMRQQSHTVIGATCSSGNYVNIYQRLWVFSCTAVQLQQYLPVSTPLSQWSHAWSYRQCDVCRPHRTQKILESVLLRNESQPQTSLKTAEKRKEENSTCVTFNNLDYPQAPPSGGG